MAGSLLTVGKRSGVQGRHESRTSILARYGQAGAASREKVRQKSFVPTMQPANGGMKHRRSLNQLVLRDGSATTRVMAAAEAAVHCLVPNRFP